MNLQGKTALITGATFGIGHQAALALARQGADVIIIGRDPARTQAAHDAISQAAGRPMPKPVLADLSVQAEVRRAAAEVKARHGKLDLLVNNAGGYFPELAQTADGLEQTWALNHLTYATLALELLPLLQAAAPARIVNVASAMHRLAGKDFGGPAVTGRYGGVRAYNQSKLANVLFTKALARRLAGTGVTVNALHPGTVATGIGRGMNGLQKVIATIVKPFLLTPTDGAKTTVFAATAPELDGVTGQYLVRSKIGRASAASRDEALQERLWSATLTALGQPDPFVAQAA